MADKLGERVAVLEQAVRDMKDGQDKIWQQVSNHLPTGLREVNDKVEGLSASFMAYSRSLEKSLDGRFAAKRTEKWLDRVMMAIVMAVVAAGMSLILIPTIGPK